MAPEEPRPPYMHFFLGGLATTAACCFTNPLDVIKTRLQLQGELQARNQLRTKPYKGPVHGLFTMVKNEGVLSIQKGLCAASLYQFFMNGTRLGSYSFVKYFLGVTDDCVGVKNIAAGATAGVAGAAMGSPFYLVKTRMQAYAEGKISVGEQHGYKSVRAAFASIVKADGVAGLTRGASAAMLRVGVGSSAQLSSYDYFKRLLLRQGWLVADDNVYTHFGASLCAGVVTVLVMNPFDVVSTRLYNSSGSRYAGVLDCIWKTATTEGLLGFYKGALAQYLRVGPHTILTFVFF